ncbi:hypothetical protein [Vibrio parahaemolyticus]|uniref:hypothetical protein n=1 Tax=Vibrio parahaemolyticus TaxID=670 RepID=UPI000C869A52|nr:hypothetical protein [Vibrio parahaemolyticus]PMS49930.1 hypothetical protein C1S89_09035 [Vibrio parahaemolyticus]PMS55001.1 hypothetical protein C1T11_00210 [Vibrio parahaemolyticus]PMS60330.1 hypothetical protein C1T09_00260 [Vibrio parahaemolyticus]PMS90418.1 hypothetical protein C1S90_00260 [Vibrio parahaemolyticus]PMS94174.1 hypothetical protein C1T06_10440 [Vibrio parahaemolyticus]
MKLTRCPVCHTNLHLDALIQDQAGKELLADVSNLPDFVARPLLAYLSLFRPAKSDLSLSRTLRLMREVTDEYRADHLLASALIECVQKLREKRQLHNDTKPLANHNYLKQVYKTLAVRNNVTLEPHKHKGEVAQKTTQPDNSAWYIEQAERMVKIGQDPLAEGSTIAAKLRELNWQPTN